MSFSRTFTWKLQAYGFSLAALGLVHNYLSNRKQRSKEITDYSSWEEILFGVPPFLYYERNQFCKLCEWQHVLCYCQKSCGYYYVLEEDSMNSFLYFSNS